MDFKDQQVEKIIPAELAYEFNFLPIKIESNTLFIGITDLKNKKNIKDIQFYSGFKTECTEIAAEKISAGLSKLYKNYKTRNNNDTNGGNTLIDFSTVEFVNSIIISAIEQNASDIHFEVYENLFRIRFRVDGRLREIINLPVEKVSSIFGRIKVLANLDISEKRRPQDGVIRFTHNSSSVDIRVSFLPTNFGEKIVLRILNKTQQNIDIEKIGMRGEQLKILKEVLDSPYGMILVTGPTGSGKTTTLYAALQYLHSPEKNILSIEDPIEYNLTGINQSNVKPDIGYTFAAALRSFLRQDPDIIMIGEIRDKETSEIAIRASLTGHLVLSTLHTNDSVSAITRLIDMGIEPYLVASSVKLILAQRLVRVLCSCKKLDSDGVYKKNGCKECGYTGYRGRTALFEMFRVNENISELISKNGSGKLIKEECLKEGFITLRDSGYEKIKSGITTYEEVIRETSG